MDMCAGCGILQNSSDWTEGFGQDNDVAVHEKLSARRKRLTVVNALLKDTGLTLREQGVQLVLSNWMGNSVVVTHLAQVWVEADKLGRKQPDPL